ncbi:MAG: glycosyltransferase family 2 protein [Actinomycetota bacterium]
MKLSAVIIALNERQMIESAVRSCAFADETIVVDGGSTDGTQDIARAAGARIAERPFDDFARQRTFALNEAQGEWVLFVDADERIPADLANAIKVTIGSATHSGYAIPRKNMVLGQWMRWHFGGEDAPVRLVRRAKASLAPHGVHEVITVEGSTGRLSTPMLHFTHRSVSDLVDKINRYSTIEANELAAKGARRPTKRALLVEFPRSFVKYWRTGLRNEGEVGAIEAAMLAFNRTLVLAKLWEHTRGETMQESYSKAESENSR